MPLSFSPPHLSLSPPDHRRGVLAHRCLVKQRLSHRRACLRARRPSKSHFQVRKRSGAPTDRNPREAKSSDRPSTRLQCACCGQTTRRMSVAAGKGCFDQAGTSAAAAASLVAITLVLSDEFTVAPPSMTITVLPDAEVCTAMTFSGRTKLVPPRLFTSTSACIGLAFRPDRQACSRPRARSGRCARSGRAMDCRPNS